MVQGPSRHRFQANFVAQDAMKCLVGIKHLRLSIGDAHSNRVVFAQWVQGFTQVLEGRALGGGARSSSNVLFCVRQRGTPTTRYIPFLRICSEGLLNNITIGC